MSIYKLKLSFNNMCLSSKVFDINTMFNHHIFQTNNNVIEVIRYWVKILFYSILSP